MCASAGRANRRGSRRTTGAATGTPAAFASRTSRLAVCAAAANAPVSSAQERPSQGSAAHTAGLPSRIRPSSFHSAPMNAMNPSIKTLYSAKNPRPSSFRQARRRLSSGSQ